MVRLLFFCTILLANSQVIFSSDIAIKASPASITVIRDMDYNKIVAIHCTLVSDHRERVVIVEKSLVTGDFTACEILIDQGAISRAPQDYKCFKSDTYVHFIPSAMMLASLKVKIAEFEN